MGAGFTGKDAFYLAAYGLDTIAAESDQACIDEPFEVVVCDMVLHFLEADKVPMAVQNLQRWAKPDGYNVVMAYTTENTAGKRQYLFKPNELADYYRTWELLSYVDEPTPWYILKARQSRPVMKPCICWHVRR